MTMGAGGLAPYALAATACAVSAAGGYAVLRLKGRLHAVFAVCAGILIGVALLDMLPEAVRLLPTGGLFAALAIAISGGLALIALECGLPTLAAVRGAAPHLGPASLTLHSLIEGLGIGLGFRLSPEVGWTVAAGVLAHDFADGANVVGLSIAAGRNRAARWWLAANSLAPLVGVTVAQVARVSAGGLGLTVALLTGIFLTIAARELVPRSIRALGPARAVLGVFAGFALVYAWTWAEG